LPVEDVAAGRCTVPVDGSRTERAAFFGSFTSPAADAPARDFRIGPGLPCAGASGPVAGFTICRSAEMGASLLGMDFVA
jgi:hypothetical protein